MSSLCKCGTFLHKPASFSNILYQRCANLEQVLVAKYFGFTLGIVTVSD